MLEPTITIHRISRKRRKSHDGITEPLTATVDAILKFDSPESRFCVYNEISALRLAQTLHVPVADGVLTTTSAGHTYASLMLDTSGMLLPNLLDWQIPRAAGMYPDETAATVAFDILIGNDDRANNLKMSMLTNHLPLYRIFDHSHCLLTHRVNPLESISFLKSDKLLVRSHPFYGTVDMDLVMKWVKRIEELSPYIFRECFIMKRPLGAATDAMQVALADALEHRRRNLRKIIEANAEMIAGTP